MSVPVLAAPRVCVLLATHNGQPWLDEQLRSVFAQEGASVTVVASDDASTDATVQTLRAWSQRAPLTLLPPPPERLGSAHRNFVRLIRDAELGNADHVALADQDDIWLPHKLTRAVHCLREHAAQAYSSNVIAFWPDGTRHPVDKAQPQRRFDHWFGSPGPGCTFVMRRDAFERLRAWVSLHFEQLQDIWVHDWLIYAFARQQGMRWYIDELPGMLYRQHGRNEIGVNLGWRAAGGRMAQMRSGLYRSRILAIADALGEDAPPVHALRRLRIGDRLWLLCHVGQCRRKASERLALGLFFILTSRGSPA